MLPDGPHNLSAVRNGTKVTCSANGNPHPEFHWNELDDVEYVHNGSELDLCSVRSLSGSHRSVDLDGDLLRFRCVAERDQRRATFDLSPLSFISVQKHCGFTGSGESIDLLIDLSVNRSIEQVHFTVAYRQHMHMEALD